MRLYMYRGMFIGRFGLIRGFSECSMHIYGRDCWVHIHERVGVWCVCGG